MVNKITSFWWDSENTICYQICINRIYVIRRQDNDMINGTKLLNIANISRGKRDGILKNEKEKVIIKNGDIYLKGIWIPFSCAKLLAIQYNIIKLLQPLFIDNPSILIYSPLYFSGLQNFKKELENNYYFQSKNDKNIINSK